MKASDCKCCVCGRRVVAFWPVIDPDIPELPYCRECLDKARLLMNTISIPQSLNCYTRSESTGRLDTATSAVTR